MSRTKSSETPHYELLYIISNKFSEEELTPIKAKVEKIIVDNGGVITFKEVWGKKKLAYPIKHFNYGYYNLIEFDLVGEKLAKVNRIIELSEEILRHQIIRTKFRTLEEITQDKKKSMDIFNKTREVTKVKDKPEVKEKIKVMVNLQELDEKLDKILETDSLL